MTGLSGAADGTLRTWIRDHRVCWELEPLIEWSRHRRLHVGYQLLLFARNAGGLRDDPGGGECEGLHEGLRAIALRVLPKEQGATRTEIEPFDAAFHLRPESTWVPEIQLTIRILHREGYLRPADQAEKGLAEEIQKGLAALGAQPRSWSLPRSA